VRFLTYNIRHAEGVDGRLSNARIVKTIREASPDVVGMNEVWRLKGLWDQPRLLGELLGMERAFTPNHERLFYGIGNEVLTRGTLASWENLPMPGGMERRGCLLARIELDGATIAFASTHLSLGRSARAAQLTFLAETLPEDIPLVMAGDLNCGPEEVRGFLGRLEVPSPPKTFPSISPRRALDHILFSHHWELESLEVIASLASDHRPLVAQLRLRDACQK